MEGACGAGYLIGLDGNLGGEEEVHGEDFGLADGDAGAGVDAHDLEDAFGFAFDDVFF